jgi:hypothetical protein
MDHRAGAFTETGNGNRKQLTTQNFSISNTRKQQRESSHQRSGKRMTQNIDFLPKSYRGKQNRRSLLRWRQIVCVVFLAIVIVGGMQQRHSRVRLESNRDQLLSRAELARKQLTNPRELHEQIQNLDHKANLRANLQLHTPPTNLLTIITSHLPPFVSLTEYQHSYENSQSNGIRTQRNRPANKRTENSPQAGTASERDLKTLQEEREKRTLTVVIKGLAKDDLSISRYLSELQHEPIFHDVRLLYTGEDKFQNRLLRGYRIRLSIRRINTDGSHSAVTSNIHEELRPGSQTTSQSETQQNHREDRS